jgi:plastocyanin
MRLPRHHRFLTPLTLGILAASCIACTDRQATHPNAVARLAPTTRTVTITTVPLLVKEQQNVLPFLKADFAKGGVLNGKEVYAFSPSTVTVVEGDTIHFVFINPEDDVHSFVLPDFSVALPPQKTTTATYVARHAGIYTFTCSIPTHLPMMWGQLVVLPPGSR